MKLKHIAIIGSLFPILFSLVLFFGVLISADSDDENSNFSSGITGMNLSAEVLKHQPMVEKYARENGISEYVNVLLAIIHLILSLFLLRFIIIHVVIFMNTFLFLLWFFILRWRVPLPVSRRF